MCECCEFIKDLKEFQKEILKKSNNKTQFNIKMKLKAGIIRETYRDNIKCGTIEFTKYNLIYCPVCGRKTEE